MFWGMVELGVGMIAICLPALRPLFHGWSAESIIRSIRSAISLRSVRSGRSSVKRSAGHSRNDVHRLGSESSIVGINMDNFTSGGVSAEGSIPGVHGRETWKASDGHKEGGIRVERDFIMSS